ncbi:DUF1499 domain-containing protein [Sphingomonas sp. LHG3406-1]|uniref:DUF1499 domain-containing protein n=1 Tax=Sphingomonas sp. LHG3406-1 TaxID=2804617 RepID=UPI0026096BAB|nr:DUF1499 domain-containing protein [Sphingomonas sp. LHG3406-1]
MSEGDGKGRWGARLSLAALLLSLGGIGAALVAAIGTGTATWGFAVGLRLLGYAFFAAIAGGVLAIVAWFLLRRSGRKAGWRIAVALLSALLFTGYLGSMILTARSVPAIHDAATDLDDLPQFRTLALRADNLERVPDQGKPELKALSPEERWKALHRQAYGDLQPLRLAVAPADALREAQALAEQKGWAVAAYDPAAGTLEATATTLFFRFKDDVVVRVRPDPGQAGGSIVDMRSVSRVGLSDLGVNARRIRSFLNDLKAAAE